MRHYKKGRKLGTDSAHTKAMKRSLVTALFLNDRIKTIDARAKEIRPDVDRIITWAKKGDLHSRRLAIAWLGDAEVVREVFDKVDQGMFAGRNGGYTRIMKLGPRKGDGAPMVIMELVREPVQKKKKDEKKDEKPAKAETKAKAKEEEKAEEPADKEAPAEEAAEEAPVEEEKAEAAEDKAEAADEQAEAAEEKADDAEEKAE
jgi:large subunit ribosomal protein L17